MNLESFPKKLENSKIFRMNSKKIGIISKKVGNSPNNLELDLNHFHKNWKNPKYLESFQKKLEKFQIFWNRF